MQTAWNEKDGALFVLALLKLWKMSNKKGNFEVSLLRKQTI